ncbi:MAG: hypothetical protein EOO88_42195 [Pedobacter sp.]|nr:MAG: hypothetical protein EOO88_42195 [Pedobacter sp.]
MNRKDAPLDIAFLNSKGFGGNNATANLLAPHVVEKMLLRRYGAGVIENYGKRREATVATAVVYDKQAQIGNFDTIYQFGQGLINENEIVISKSQVTLPGFAQPIDLHTTSRFADMCN